jgi:hypothetical protein
MNPQDLPESSGQGRKSENVLEPSATSGQRTSPRTTSPGASAAARARKDKKTRPRWPPVVPGSAAALALLTLRPVGATPVPRHHIAPRAADGARRIHDRATSEQFVVYSPRFISQFQAGHQAGLWYLRLAADRGSTPRSVGFRTSRAAVEALGTGRWRLPNS